MSSKTNTANPSSPFDGMEISRALPSHAREHNRSLVVRVLYRGAPMSRADVARTTGLAKVTVSDLIQELMDAGYVEELGMQAMTGPGKPAILVDLARKSQLVVAVDLSDHHEFRGALMDLDAEIVHRVSIPRDGKTGEEAVDLLYSLIEQLLDAAEKPILGIGIGTPGIVNPDGIVVFSQNLDWDELPLQELVSDRFKLPVIVDNDANLAALGENLFGEASDNFLLLTVGHGIGAGIVLDGQLIRGTNDSSGEVGLVVVGTEQGLEAPYNTDYTLENWLSVPALERRWEGKDKSERKEVLHYAGQLLGITLAPLVAALDLSEIVLAGPQEAVNQELVDVTKEVITRRTLPGTCEDLDIRVSSLGENLVFLGCSASTLSKVLGVS